MRVSVMGILLHGRIGTPRQAGTLLPFTSMLCRVEAAAVALPAEGGDGARVGQEELRLPPPAEQLVQVVGGGRPAAGVDALLEVGVVQQPELAVVDHLVLLALAQRLDGQPELLLDLVHRLVVEVGDPGVDPQHGLGHAQLVLAGRGLVVDEGARQLGLAVVAGGQLDGGLTVLVLRLLRAGLEPLDVCPQRLGLGDHLLEHLLRQRQHRARG